MDLLKYYVQEGFVYIVFWFNERGRIEGNVSALKTFDPLIDKTDQGPTLTWISKKGASVYKADNKFYSSYGIFFNSQEEALNASKKWIEEVKSTHKFVEEIKNTLTNV
jgi:hypothetical protein